MKYLLYHYNITQYSKHDLLLVIYAFLKGLDC